MLDLFLDPAVWATLAILVGLELALGVDNIIFVSLVVARVPEAQRDRARRIGLAISVLVQIALLAAMLWIAGVERTAFSIFGWSPGWNELAFLAGGLFLAYKAISELHIHIERGPRPPAETSDAPGLSFAAAIVQVAAINAVFSVDTIVTAVGITREPTVIVAAIFVTTAIIYVATGPISAFIARHKSVRGVALAFLLMVGGSLISEGLGLAIDPVFLYSVIGVGTALLFAIKLWEHLRNRATPMAATPPQMREEPRLDAPDVAAPARDDEALEEPAVLVQESPPKRRAPRRKAPRKARASSQG